MINDNFKIIGGAERYFFNLVKLLKDRGHKVFTLTFADFERFKDNDFVLKQYQNKFGQFLAHRFISFRYFKIRKIIKRVQPDIIHLHNIYENHYSILLAGRGCRVIQTVHDLNFIFPGYLQSFYKNTNDFLLKIRVSWHRFINNLFINYFLVPSQFLEKEMIKYKYKNLIVLPYFLDSEPIRTDKNNKLPIILYSGRLTQEKGIDHLITFLNYLLTQEKYFQLIVAGEGPEKSILQKIAENNSQLKLAGWLAYDQLKKLYAQADLLIVTSSVPENSPLVIYEALTHQLPVVAFAIGGIGELIKNNNTGFLIEPGNAKIMAEKVNELLKNNGLLKIISLNIKNYLNQADNPYGQNRHYHQLINIYDQIRNNLPANHCK